HHHTHGARRRDARRAEGNRRARFHHPAERLPAHHRSAQRIRDEIRGFIMKRYIVCLCAALSMCALGKTFDIETNGVTLRVDDESGNYAVMRTEPAQTWSGSLGTALKHVMQGEGHDGLGD